MSIIVMANNGIENIRAEMDGAIYDIFADNKDFIVKDFGNEFTISSSSSSLRASVGSGLALIGGRLYKIEGSETLTLNANAQNNICLRIDLSAGDGAEGTVINHPAAASIVKENLNTGGTVRDMLLARVHTNSSGVSSVQDYRNISSAREESSVLQVSSSASGDVSLADGTVTICSCATTDINSGSRLTKSDGGVKIVTAGQYKVSGSVYIVSSGNANRVGCYIQKNTVDSSNELTSQYLGADPNSAFRGNIFSGERIVYLNANDVVYLCARIKGTGTAGHRWLTVESVKVG